MTRSRLPTPFAALLGALGTFLVAAAPAFAAAPMVVFRSPPAGQPLFGEQTVELAVEAGAPVEEVTLRVDDRPIERLETPPWTFTVDLGQENREHRLVARATAGGETGEAVLVSPKIRVDEQVDADLHQLYVTVTEDGRRILDLREEDFVILDNGDRQEISTFAGGDVRITAGLLIDASSSMAGGRLRSAIRGAEAFLAGLERDDEASVTLFSDRLLAETPLLGEDGRLQSMLAEARAAGGTALHDHVYRALKDLELRQGRRVVVLLSDGIDSHSALRMQEVRWLLRRSRALVYWIRIGGDPGRRLRRFSAWKDADAYELEYRLLVESVAETGGRILDLEDIEDADEAFAEVLAELREQYVIGYFPSDPGPTGTWHEVRVRVDRRGVGVRAQKGYVEN